MREDFFYRINIVPINLPPLRKRKEDIPLLMDHFFKMYCKGTPPRLSGKLLEILNNYDWPGNIRELQNTLHRFITLNDSEVITSLPFNSTVCYDNSTEAVEKNQHLKITMENIEKNIIIKTLSQKRWHRGNTASSLGITRRTLERKIKNYEILKYDNFISFCVLGVPIAMEKFWALSRFI